MKIVVIGAGSMAFTPALLSGFSLDKRYIGATIGLVDVNQEVLDLIARVARRVSDEWNLHWTIEASTERRDVLLDADVVTTSIGVGSLDVWQIDVDIPFRYGIIQPVGDTSGPGGLLRALRHIPVLVAIAKDMETLCPRGILYNFTNPLTVNTQAINTLTKTPCVGLCIGLDDTWQYLCQAIGVDQARTNIVAGGINHCHWIIDFRLDGQNAFPIFDAALQEMEGNPEAMAKLRAKYEVLAQRPNQPSLRDTRPLCTALYRLTGCYPGPGDGHVGEFYPQFVASTLSKEQLGHYQGAALRNVHATYPRLWQKLNEAADPRLPLDAETFGKEMFWEHTQLLDLLVSQQDNLGKLFFINVPNKGYIHNLPDGTVVEIPAHVDAAGFHPLGLGDLSAPIMPTLARQAAVYDLIIEAAMTGSRRRAVQAFCNDPYCTDISLGEKLINEMIDAELPYLPAFR